MFRHNDNYAKRLVHGTEHAIKIAERLSYGKGEVFEEVDGNAILGIRRPRGFQPDYLSLGREVGNGLDIHERQGCGNSEGEKLTGLERRLVVEVEEAPRQTDIPDNSLALVQFTAFRVEGLVNDRQRNYETIKASSFHGGEHTTPIKVVNVLNLMQGVCHKV